MVMHDPIATGGGEQPVISAETAAHARRIYAQRRLRSSAFGKDADLFGEPCWDMMLDLYVQQASGKRITVSDLCLAAAVPLTTALRWVGTLEGRGLLRRRVDASDRRRSFVDLTSKGSATMGQALAEMIGEDS